MFGAGLAVTHLSEGSAGTLGHLPDRQVIAERRSAQRMGENILIISRTCADGLEQGSPSASVTYEY
ncbi:hypothetical protein C1J01_12660 [Nonomuraea aridisoli]|uniref:Uncharacterized protein n=1 Tax=Nonomuraea aridisoli TaxID=2070368 RepID=A0A2W2EA11_9ACTN|nr:hypothetical protein C1J01_12660 [Nonomuraea aridisoli]